MQNRLKQEFTNATCWVTDFHSRLNIGHVHNRSNDLKRRKILSPVFLADRFFQERFKELAFKIVINVFKRTKIIESFKDFVKNCSVSRNCFIIFRYKNSTINDCGFVFWISGKKLFDFYTDNRGIEFEHIVFIITGIFSK